MIDIKKVNPGIAFLNQLLPLSDPHVLQLAEKSSELEPHPEYISIVQKAFTTHSYNYTLLNGYMPLREKIAEYIQEKYKHKYSPKFEVTVTAGATQAIAAAIACSVKDSDEVIIFEPSFYTFSSMVVAAGARPVYIPLKSPNFQIDWDEVQKVITSRTRLIIINSPHNPTGAILTTNDLERLSKIVNGTNIQILSDESFNNMLFDGYEHQGIAQYAKLAERAFLVASLGKFFEVEGWKIGFCAAPAKMMDDFRRFQHVLSFTVNTPVQMAITGFFEHKDIYQAITAKFQQKRDFLLSSLKNSRFKMIPALGGYFQLMNYSRISGQKDTDFVQTLLTKNKIATLPLSCFYHDATDNGYIRICLAQTDETLAKAAEILCSL
jgi:methionine transaminase